MMPISYKLRKMFGGKKDLFAELNRLSLESKSAVSETTHFNTTFFNFFKLKELLLILTCLRSLSHLSAGFQIKLHK